MMATDFEWRKHEVMDGKHPSFDGTLVVVEPVLDDEENVVATRRALAGATAPPTRRPHAACSPSCRATTPNS
jgi:hypothetical protein